MSGSWSTHGMHRSFPAAGPIRVTFGRLCRDTRIRLDLSQQHLAERVGVSRGYIGKLERGEANPSLALVETVAEALGLDLTLIGRPPVFIGGAHIRDAVHARCTAYVGRRLKSHGLLTEREVEIVQGRSHGWIDLLAFDPRSGTLVIVEVKTRLDDLGAMERQLRWYERESRTVARRIGWDVRRTTSWLLVLASDEVDVVLRQHRALFDDTFPRRARELLADVTSHWAAPRPGRGLAMVDPASRRRDWLIRTRLDGRRSPGSYAGYGDAAGRLARAA